MFLHSFMYQVYNFIYLINNSHKLKYFLFAKSPTVEIEPGKTLNGCEVFP